MKIILKCLYKGLHKNKQTSFEINGQTYILYFLAAGQIFDFNDCNEKTSQSSNICPPDKRNV